MRSDRLKQAGWTINGQGKTVVCIPLNVSHQAKQLEIAEQQFILAGGHSDEHSSNMTGSVEHPWT